MDEASEMNIVLDLDGTLIDSKLRLYALFQRLTQTSNLSYSEYWALKQDKVSNQAILARNCGFDEFQIQQFMEEWMVLIEAPEFIEFDSNFPLIHNTLSLLKDHAELYVCTARQHRHIALEQLDRLKLLPYFREVLVTEQRATKEELIELHVPKRSKQDWIVGDTGKDIVCGKALGMKTCAVLSGFLSRVRLLEYRPDLVSGSLGEFQSKILECQ